MIARKAVSKGPKRGLIGHVDIHGRVWIKDRAHGNVPDHWDVQLDDGNDYIRVGLDGNLTL